ncbi:2-oxoglutarate dehydrogenase E1 component [Anaplasma phagocytophilum]|uniref:2-oxoglutarate dehydrogenase E1 component n=2 Tax=Anaplasma phagocytophilum TaxID=948 RepID=A0A0F3PZB0_ANAPH|nr:2-oxoglutarate dehydrogenase E1 component [Anaplasma phagocytophilum]EOA62322.1 2-oxoglutarate dehydrogenase E1 component [Anaplasma phagocytophilum str. CRT38]KDB57146.1 2-oxoglutarate dehydrogenase [Anaplasma phagocytophilum str. CRT35]KJV85715.1 oxoglutarate dehydrogenase (succinyl-transferring), E1 component [Anaplasma phagocytophilum str. CRT53-1]
MSNSSFRRDGCLYGDNALFVEEVYEGYEKCANALPDGWGELFTRIEEGKPEHSDRGRTDYEACSSGTSVSPKVWGLIDFFRSHGHIAADLDPLGLTERVGLGHEEYLSSIDPNKDGSLWQKSGFSLDRLLEKLKKIYCGKIGFEFMYIRSNEERTWLQNKIENMRLECAGKEKRELLFHLQETELFEQFLHVKYPGYKRFSVEGGDVLIVALEEIISLSPSLGVQEIVIGMSHRGRLSVLTKVMKKPYVAMLHEFSGGMAYPSELNVTGDVKYHLGYSSDREVQGEVIHLSLAYNPSHLESVNPVVMGRVKGKIDSGLSVLGVLVHGDAAFIGQGVVAEGLNIGGVEGYTTGGIVHIVVNNQVGFTTSPNSARTSLYCSDVARIIDAPVFHVNGDDPEAVVAVTKLAMEYRDKFKKDVVIDVVCYRRYGHNEGDEPMFTQPLMYKCIAQHRTVAGSYGDKLVAEGVVSTQEIEEFRKKFRAELDKAHAAVFAYKPMKADWFEGCWKGLRYAVPGCFDDYMSDTGVAGERLLALMEAMCSVPEGISLDKKVSRMLNARLNGVKSDSIDWGAGEALAFASLLAENKRVRLSGEDCGRGTFSHRHARLIDQATGAEYLPLNNLGVEQAKFEVFNSPLSEFAVMGFEYGYSLDSPDVLVIWEAQFGDFANGAQVVIDQFIAAAETKWLRSSGLVLLLPHGYEGQGSEHSSARIERYLQLCAEDNMQVVNCTTPANYFHVLRRQLHRDFRKPLVIFTPKSLLRNRMAVSKLSCFEGRFQPVIGEVMAHDHAQVKRVVICSGKVYYDLLEARGDRQDIALLRLEQYYPFPEGILAKELAKYSSAEVIWCQEEHFNMGGWDFVRPRIEKSMKLANLKGVVAYIGRAESASTAAGYARAHEEERKCFIDEVFA